MSTSSVDRLERLEEILAQLEVSPAQLRRDPNGRDWLPAEARALVEVDPKCAAMLREFVDDELALLDALEGPAHGPPAADPFFTARVVDALPQAFVPNRLSPRRRLLVLGLFHLVAVGLALWVLAMVPESTARWAEQAHSMLSWGSEAGSWITASAIAAVVVLVFVGSLSRSSSSATKA